METIVKEEIKKWGMSSAEIKAYKLALIWEDLTRKMFPDVKLAKLPKRGDPRKGSLFKYCWKLQRELNGILEEKEYHLYITGNLVILKNNNGRIDPNAICGEKAWKRWKVWKKFYDKKMIEINSRITNRSEKELNQEIISQLDNTKKFLFKQLGKNPAKEQLQKAIQENMLKYWAVSLKVSKYYLVLSPYIKEIWDEEKMEEDCNFDTNLYLKNITSDIKNYFRSEFEYEFKL